MTLPPIPYQRRKSILCHITLLPIWYPFTVTNTTIYVITISFLVYICGYAVSFDLAELAILNHLTITQTSMRIITFSLQVSCSNTFTILTISKTLNTCSTIKSLTISDSLSLRNMFIRRKSCFTQNGWKIYHCAYNRLATSCKILSERTLGTAGSSYPITIPIPYTIWGNRIKVFWKKRRGSLLT